MATHKQRFAVGDPAAARSAEWVVMWMSDTSDVYLAARSLGNSLRVSLHESGNCFIRGPQLPHLNGSAAPPKRLDDWWINLGSELEHPIGIIVPHSELRGGAWLTHRDKGTIWIRPQLRTAVEVRVFLSRAEPPAADKLICNGWHTTIVRTRLPDGRYLAVVAGDADLPNERRAELEAIKARTRAEIAQKQLPLVNPRLMLTTGSDEHDTRHLVEAPVNG